MYLNENIKKESNLDSEMPINEMDCVPSISNPPAYPTMEPMQVSPLAVMSSPPAVPMMSPPAQNNHTALPVPSLADANNVSQPPTVVPPAQPMASSHPPATANVQGSSTTSRGKASYNCNTKQQYNRPASQSSVRVVNIQQNFYTNNTFAPGMNVNFNCPPAARNGWNRPNYSGNCSNSVHLVDL